HTAHTRAGRESERSKNRGFVAGQQRQPTAYGSPLQAMRSAAQTNHRKNKTPARMPEKFIHECRLPQLSFSVHFMLSLFLALSLSLSLSLSLYLSLSLSLSLSLLGSC